MLLGAGSLNGRYGFRFRAASASPCDQLVTGDRRPARDRFVTNAKVVWQRVANGAMQIEDWRSAQRKVQKVTPRRFS